MTSSEDDDDDDPDDEYDNDTDEHYDVTLHGETNRGHCKDDDDKDDCDANSLQQDTSHPYKTNSR